jgi:hypothetical protein
MDEPATPRVGAGHVVLWGLNELGYRTLEELSRMGAEVVVVVRAADADLAAGARALGATLVQGSYRDESVLRAAGVPAAAALVVTEDDDVGWCGTARRSSSRCCCRWTVLAWTEAGVGADRDATA